jgi:hypothetical protein
MKTWSAAVLMLMLTLAGCGGSKKQPAAAPAKPAPTPAKGAAPWPAPADPVKLTRQAGLTPETQEFVFLHVHAHLDVFVNGKRVVVPAGLGVDVTNPAVRRFKANDGSIGYGGISPPCAQPCISPLHTHFTDGVLHTEAKENQFNTLGELFTEWSVRLTPTCVGGYCKPTAPFTVYVDGTPFDGDPRTIELQDKREIAVVIGSPPATIPSQFG